jgi:hypothetical protein
MLLLSPLAVHLLRQLWLPNLDQSQLLEAI